MQIDDTRPGNHASVTDIEKQIRRGKAVLRELKATLEDLEDRRELAAAKKRNRGKPGTPLREAAQEGREILKEVQRLSSEERQELWNRVAADEARKLDPWEKQIERDSKAGKLDHLLSELRDDIKAGRVKPLDEVINEP